MILSPPVLFLDEPTTGLDPSARYEVWDAIRTLVDGGTTVLLTTRYLEEADRLAEWNPMSATATACRELFGDSGPAGTSWAAQHSILMAVVWPLVIAAVFVPLSVRRYRAMGG